MCGIAGIRLLDGGHVDPDRLEIMSNALEHRGPDGHGHYLADGIGLAHRRLAIIEPGIQGHQPMSLADGSLLITFNGEIHNHVELRATLEREGHRFRTRTDTEVILAVYRHWGIAGFDRLNGPWAFALWDEPDRTLILCRDRFGQRPLFWSRRGARIAFASETRALLAAFPEEREPDFCSVQRFVAGDAPHRDERSFLAKVRSVEPASVLRFDAQGRERRDHYWSFRPGPVESRADDAERVRNTLEDAIRLRLRSDAPLGALLSGGLDSGAVVRLAGRLSGQPLSCYSLRYKSGIDESRMTQLTADDRPAHAVHWVEPTAEGLFDRIRKVAWFGDGPLPMRGKIAMWSLYEAASRELKVTLDGSGSDEIFAGYVMKYQLPFALDHLRRHRFALHRRAVRQNLAGHHGAAGFRPRRLYKSSRSFAKSLWCGHRDRPLMSVVSPDFVADDVYTDVGRARHAWWHLHRDSPFEARLDTALWQELMHGDMRESLHAQDMLAMAHGVETRAPFLDHRLVELAFSLPAETKIRSLRTKALLRESLADTLPREVLDERQKQGLPAPWDLWSAESAFVNEARDFLTDARSRARPWFDADGYSQLFERLGTRAGPYTASSEALWRLLSLEHWMRDVVEA